MTLTVVPIRDNAPLLSDIPNQLRQLADQIESGEVEAESLMCVIPNDGDWPEIYGWGEDLGEYGRIGLLQLAVGWFVNNRVAR